MDSPIATININIGMGKDNPFLKIRANDDISALVDQLIQNYQLPKKVHSIIMGRVNQQIPQTPKTQMRNGENSKQQSSTLKKKAMSPLKSSNLSSKRHNKIVMINKQNNPNLSNWQSETNKASLLKRDNSVSPLKKTGNQTILKKIEIKTNKSPAKYTAFSKKADEKKQVICDPYSKISKLFRRLTKNNPSNVKIMSPEFINLKGLDKNLLGYLQQFFQSLEEDEFDKMNESYFVNKTEQLGFMSILSKKKFDYCYID